jgi:hypothetical protein
MYLENWRPTPMATEPTAWGVGVGWRGRVGGRGEREQGEAWLLPAPRARACGVEGGQAGAGEAAPAGPAARTCIASSCTLAAPMLPLPWRGHASTRSSASITLSAHCDSAALPLSSLARRVHSVWARGGAGGWD